MNKQSMARAILILFAVLCICGICSGIGAKEESAEPLEPIIAEQTPTVAKQTIPTQTPTNTPVPEKEPPVELTVYSQLTSFWGEQQGWFADIIREKFNVVLQIEPFLPEDKNHQGDIILFASTGKKYKTAVEEGWLLDWEENNLLKEHGSYIAEHMSKALEHNRELTPEQGGIYGLGNSVAPGAKSVGEYLYTWDIRWDLYQKLGHPGVTDLDSLALVLERMKQICPVGENGEETYGVSLWSEWDDDLVFAVTSMTEAYYGSEEFYLGLYDVEDGGFQGALEEDGAYLRVVEFLNILYRKGLLDPESISQSYAETVAKMQNGEVFFSLYEYAGSSIYNTEFHKKENTYMAPLVPAEATLVAYGLSVTGGNKIWSISANTDYPQLCMELLNWLCTPEGVMTAMYGPQGVIWEYDENGCAYFTEFGKQCRENGSTLMNGEYSKLPYGEGIPHMNFTTWNAYSENPDSNGEQYHWSSWKHNIAEIGCDAEQDWRSHTEAQSRVEYLNQQQVVVSIDSDYEKTEAEELAESWEKVSNCIKTGTWRAIYADSEEDFNKIIAGMREEALNLEYEECILWCENQAMVRRSMEEKVLK